MILIGCRCCCTAQRENFMNYYVQLEQSKRLLGPSGTSKAERGDLVNELAQQIEDETGREKVKVRTVTANVS